MKTIKDELTLLSNKMSSNARVDLYDKNYLFRIKWAFPILLLVSLITLSVLFSTGMMNQTQLIISSLIVMILLFIVQILARRARVAALKGDSIILKGINSKSTVTSLKSIRKASSYQILGIPVTHLNYTLDHQNKTSIVFGSPSGMKSSLDQLIQHAKKCKK